MTPKIHRVDQMQHNHFSRVDQVGIDQMGVDQMGVDQVGINRKYMMCWEINLQWRRTLSLFCT
jgi:hypothetical protein